MLLETRLAKSSDFKPGAARNSKFLLPSGDESRTQGAFARTTPAYVFFVQRCVKLSPASWMQKLAVKLL